MVKKTVKKFIPVGARDWLWDSCRSKLNLLKHSTRDMRRFSRYNLSIGRKSRGGRIRFLMMCTHILEKGLALRETKPFFGKDVVIRVLNDAVALREDETVPNSIINSAFDAVESYLVFNEKQKKEATRADNDFIARIKKSYEGARKDKEGKDLVTIISKTREQVLSATRQSLSEAIMNRHSLRMFDEKPVERSVIDKAIAVAQRSPSACNLQPIRLHITTDREKIDQALAIQSGARGFYSEVKVLFVVTFDLTLQIGPRSRHQGYTDGGLFAQTLMLALLNEGVGSCPLNWAQEIATDNKLRDLLNLPENENIVMLVAAGHLPDSFEVAGSHRINIDAVRNYID